MKKCIITTHSRRNTTLLRRWISDPDKKNNYRNPPVQIVNYVLEKGPFTHRKLNWKISKFFVYSRMFFFVCSLSLSLPVSSILPLTHSYLRSLSGIWRSAISMLLYIGYYCCWAVAVAINKLLWRFLQLFCNFFQDQSTPHTSTILLKWFEWRI